MVTKIDRFFKNDERIDNWLRQHVSVYVQNKPLADHQLEHVLDYLASPSSPRRLARLSVDQAIDQSNKWTDRLNKKYKHFSSDETGEIEIFKSLDYGFNWVCLKSERSYSREGSLMGHCVGSYVNIESKIYSLRDRENLPHCTIEVKDGEIQQIKGKQNKAVVERYHELVMDFIMETGFICSPNDLENINAFLVFRNGREVYISPNRLQNGDLVKSPMDIKDAKELTGKNLTLSFEQLGMASIHGSLTLHGMIRFNLPLTWTVKNLIIQNVDLTATTIDCFRIESRDSRINSKIIRSNSVDVINSTIQASRMDINDLTASQSTLITKTLVSEDVATTDSTLLIESSKIKFLAYQVYKKMNSNTQFFSGLELTDYLELKGIFSEDFSFPKVNIKTITTSDSSINFIPSYVACDKIFVTGNTLVEARFKEKIEVLSSSAIRKTIKELFDTNYKIKSIHFFVTNLITPNQLSSSNTFLMDSLYVNGILFQHSSYESTESFEIFEKLSIEEEKKIVSQVMSHRVKLQARETVNVNSVMMYSVVRDRETMIHSGKLGNFLKLRETKNA